MEPEYVANFSSGWCSIIATLFVSSLSFLINELKYLIHALSHLIVYPHKLVIKFRLGFGRTAIIKIKFDLKSSSDIMKKNQEKNPVI